MNPLKTKVELATPDGPVLVDGLIASESSAFAAHRHPFRQAWGVTHLQSGFAAAFRWSNLEKAEALWLAKALDAAGDWSGVQRRGTGVTGLTKDLKMAANKVFSEFEATIRMAR
jgi:hypothetical protein